MKKISDEMWAQWEKERNAAVESQSVKKFREFYEKWRLLCVYDERIPYNNYVLEISLRKMACNIPEISEETKKEAASWLRVRGMGVSF